MVGVGLPNTTIFYAVGHLGPVRGGARRAQPRPHPTGCGGSTSTTNAGSLPPTAKSGCQTSPVWDCRPRRKRCFGNAASLRIGGTEVVGGVERAEGPSTARDDHRRPAIRGLA